MVKKESASGWFLLRKYISMHDPYNVKNCIRSSLFWDVTQPLSVVSYRRFGDTLSVNNYQPRNITQERNLIYSVADTSNHVTLCVVFDVWQTAPCPYVCRNILL